MQVPGIEIILVEQGISKRCFSAQGLSLNPLTDKEEWIISNSSRQTLSQG